MSDREHALGLGDAQEKPPPRVRLLAMLAYAGLAPVVWLLPARRRVGYLEAQCAQSLALFLVFGLIVLFNALLFLLASYLLVFHRHFYESQPVERVIFDITGTLLLLWLVAWLIGLVHAARGSGAGIPYLARLRQSRRAIVLGFAAVVTAYLLAIVVAAAVLHAGALSERAIRPAQAYMLFDDIGWVPHWVFALGFYPIARQARAQWGPDSVVVTPFTLEALDAALEHGEFVFLSSHGTEEGLYTRERWFSPQDAEVLGRGEDLKFVYITGCDSGLQARAWEAALAPAQVRTFNRLSAVIEHIYWLWFRGPATIKQLGKTSVKQAALPRGAQP